MVMAHNWTRWPEDIRLTPLTIHRGVTTANGNAFGTSLIDAALITAQAQGIIGARVVLNPETITALEIGDAVMFNTITGEITVAGAFSAQVVAGIPFALTSAGGGGGGAPILAPSIGLWMFGICDPGMAGSATVLVLPNLAGFVDDLFNDNFYIQVIYNDNAPGTPPEGEIRRVTDYVGATGTFTTNAFTANVEADDLVCVIHESLISPTLEVLSDKVMQIFNLVNAIQFLTETGGTLTTTGAEQDVYINNAPAGVYHPRKVMIDLTPELAADTLVVRTYYRIAPAGGLILKDELTFAGVQTPPLKNIELEPNRYGVQVTMQRTGGADHPYDWAAFYEV